MTSAQILALRSGASPDDCEDALRDAGGDVERALTLVYDRGHATLPHAVEHARTLAASLAGDDVERANALRTALGTEPHRAFDVARALPHAEVLTGPIAHRRGLSLGQIAVLTDASGGDTTPVLVMVSGSPAHARAAVSNWVGVPAAPIPFAAPAPARKSRTKPKASAPAPDSGSPAPMAASLRKQIARLKGTFATNAPPTDTALDTFARVTWPSGVRFVYGDPEAGISFAVHISSEPHVRGVSEPLCTLAYDDLQFYLVARAGDASDDPMVYRVDHDGSSALDVGKRLSAWLATVRSMSTAPAKGFGPELIEAIRTLDAARAVDLVKRGGAKALADVDKAGFTPLHYAAMAGLTLVVEALLAAGADANAVVRSQMKFGEKLLGDTWGNGGREAMPGETPLISAICEYPKPPGHARDVAGVVRALLTAGADPEKVDRFGRNALQFATRLPKTMDDVTLALLAAGANPNTESSAIGSAIGNTLTSFSIPRLRALLEAGADPNRVTAGSVWQVKGPTAMHMAAIWNLPEALDVLVAHGGDVNARAADGSLPLACAKNAALAWLQARGARTQ